MLEILNFQFSPKVNKILGWKIRLLLLHPSLFFSDFLVFRAFESVKNSVIFKIASIKCMKQKSSVRLELEDVNIKFFKVTCLCLKISNFMPALTEVNNLISKDLTGSDKIFVSRSSLL